ncbi:glycosyltransferase family 2 protein [Phaeovulum sp. W22_SRMD_FR3]|uniref:glycosyltransferase family 2 protein n=1 Tax=Phaeovulum sp. W22_SRMD_FR3 TaxID=3240274 RepID=UPI003F9D1521
MADEVKLARWGVVATMDEPAVLIAAWAAHHLSIGAEEVHICLDRPNPEAEALLAGMPGCHLHADGEDGWAGAWKRKRPIRHQARQKYNASRILAETGLDWIVHCDADEYIHPLRSFGRELGMVPEAKAWLKLEVGERVYLDPAPGPDIFSGIFRLKWQDFDEDGAEVYGEERAYLSKGLVGHAAGKPVVRSGHGYAIGVHFALRDYQATKLDLPYRSSYNAMLLHFDGLTPLHYMLKMLRRATTVVTGEKIPYVGARLAQFQTMADKAGDAEAMRDFWWACQGLRPDQVAGLDERHLLERVEHGIAATTRARFGDRVDLSPAAFDRQLIAHEAALIEKAREQLGFDITPFAAHV